MNGRILIFIFFSFRLFHSQAQQDLLPLNTQFSREEALLNKPEFIHSAVRPIRSLSLVSLKDERYWEERAPYKSWFMRKLKQESLIKVDTGDFKLQIDPLYNFYFADLSNSNGDRVFTNGRGVMVRGSIGSKFSFFSSLNENQSYFPNYLQDFVNYYGVVPGNGRVKPFKQTGYDYAMASGYLSYSPYKNLHFLAGHFKQFIGEGYRSLLLSDNAFNYPFLRGTASFWKHKLEYTYSIASLRRLERIPATNSTEAQFIGKLMSYNYLSFKPIRQIELGLFESFMWQRWDSTGTLPLQSGVFLPVIGLNALAHGLNGDSNNGLLGINIKINPVKGFTIYSQYAKGNANAQDAVQVGAKLYNLGIKELNLRLEYNTVSGNMYTGNNRFLSYSHYGQSMAHVQGRNFNELYFQLNYRLKDFFIQVQIADYKLKRDSIAWRSQDIYKDFVPPSFEERVLSQDFQLGYLINPAYNLNLAVGYRRRSGAVEAYGQANWFYLVLRTSIDNLYFDF